MAYTSFGLTTEMQLNLSLNIKKKWQHTTSAIKTGHDDRYASSVVSTKFSFG